MKETGSDEIGSILKEGRDTLSFSGMASPQWDALLLMAHCLNREKEFVLARRQERLSETQKKRFRELIRKRSHGVPLQYLRGRQEFWGRDFLVNPFVLIPRPETELIVERVLGHVKNSCSSRWPERAQIADIGTGSGCLAVTLALEIENCRVLATDISSAAIGVARKNARRWGVSKDQLKFLRGDLLQPIFNKRNLDPLSIIVSNPPYIAWKEKEELPPEVREYEPEVALFAEEEGTALLRKLIGQAENALVPQGALFLEIGYGQAEAVEKMFLEAIWESITIWKDNRGIPRCVEAHRKS